MNFRAKNQGSAKTEEHLFVLEQRLQTLAKESVTGEQFLLLVLQGVAYPALACIVPKPLFIRQPHNGYLANAPWWTNTLREPDLISQNT